MVKAAFVMKGMFSNLLILLKQKSVFGKNIVIFAVTPCVGVWIEIFGVQGKGTAAQREAAEIIAARSVEVVKGGKGNGKRYY